MFLLLLDKRKQLQRILKTKYFVLLFLQKQCCLYNEEQYLQELVREGYIRCDKYVGKYLVS